MSNEKQRLYKRIEDINFRQFKDVGFDLGEKITIIAGKNGTGKSLLLALLAQSAGLTSEEHRTILGKEFQAQFAEIIKGQRKNDPSGDCATITFGDNTKRILRVGPRGSGIRLVARDPIKKKGDEGFEEKKRAPVIYLGLSRLYPLGESKKINSESAPDWTQTEEAQYKKWYEEIFPMPTDRVRNVKIIKVATKTTSGTETVSYPAVNISTGQDNVGQILQALCSLIRVTTQYPGALFIDELDATLHPFARNKLFKIIRESCSKYGIQVIFTTHDIGFIHHFYTQTQRENCPPEKRDISLVYLTKNQDGEVNVKEDPDFHTISDDLHTRNETPLSIPVFTEDEEAEWMLKALLPRDIYYHLTPLHIRKIGKDDLLKLQTGEASCMIEMIYVFDGDLEPEKKEQFKIKGTSVSLPGKDQSPEKLIFDYLLALAKDHPLRSCFDKEVLIVTGPKSDDRNLYKSWFKDNKENLDRHNVMETWIRDNPESYGVFLESFKTIFDQVKKARFLR